MADRSKIEWTDATWNPTRGCTRVSEGCVNCYAEIMAARFSEPGLWGHGFAEIVRKVGDPLWLDHRWTGKVELVEDKLLEPLKWKKPRRIFVNSTSDLFHEKLPDEAIDKVFAVMALCPQHTFQILTKRPERMREYMTSNGVRDCALRANAAWPLPNVWLGTSCEDQATANERIPHLLQTPAAIRFVSCEPLLGPIDLTRGMRWETEDDFGTTFPLTGDELSVVIRRVGGPRLDWVIVGGESGKGARPMHPAWARDLRDQCATAGVKFFFKQWGEWELTQVIPGGDLGGDMRADRTRFVQPDREPDGHFRKGDVVMARAGKKAAGRLLDGREHSEFPEAR